MEFPLLDKLKSSDTSSTKNLISYKRASPDLSSAIVGYARDLLRFGNCLKDSLDLVGPPYVLAWIVNPPKFESLWATSCYASDLPSGDKERLPIWPKSTSSTTTGTSRVLRLVSTSSSTSRVGHQI